MLRLDEGGQAEEVADDRGVDQGVGFQAGIDHGVLGAGVGHAVNGSTNSFAAVGEGKLSS